MLRVRAALLAATVVLASGESLHEAASSNDAEALATLLEKGAPTEELDENGMTALHVAAYLGHTEALDVLGTAGAALEARTEQGAMTPLHWAAGQGQADAVRTLLRLGANLEATDSGKRTSLHFAASRGFLDVIEALVAAGARLEALTERKVTPLQMAAEGGHTALIGILVQAGADLEARGDQGRMRPLMVASAMGHADSEEAPGLRTTRPETCPEWPSSSLPTAVQ